MSFEFFQTNMYFDQSMKEIKAKLGYLNKSRLEQIVEHIQFELLPNQVTTKEEDLYLVIKLLFQRELYLTIQSWDSFERTKFRSLFKEKFVAISPLLERFSKYTKRERMVIIYYFLSLVLEKLSYTTITLSFFIRNLDQLPGVVAQSFPGYLQQEEVLNYLSMSILRERGGLDVSLPE